MSEAPDPLEAELSALRPHDVSPGLRRRVAERLAPAHPGLTPPARHERVWRLAVAGGLAAAALAVILFLWRSGRRVEQEQNVVRPQPAPPVAVEDPGPRLLAYQRAFARSPEELDALLDQHALVPREPGSELVQMGAATRSDAAFHALLGED
jgi:hypothetical protein